MKFPGNLYGQGGKAVPRTVEEDLRIQVADLTAKLERLTQEKDEQCKAKEVFFNGMNDIREQREALRREVAELTRQLDAQHAEIRDMRKSIDTAAKGIVRLTTERDDLTAKLKAKDSALEFAKAAIGDAIYLEEGLDGETGQRVQRLIVEALERGTCDAPGDIADFLTTRERVTQDQITALTRRLEEAQRNSVPIKYFKAVQVNDPHSPVAEYMAETHDGEFVSRSVADALQAKLAAVTQERDAAKERVRDLIAKLDILSKYVWCETGEFGFPDGDVIQVRKGRNYTDLRTALLRLAQAMRGGE